MWDSGGGLGADGRRAGSCTLARTAQELKSKRDAALDEVNRDEEALQQASTLRMKENKEFHADEVNLIEAIKACDQAITVLKEYNPKPGFVQEAARKLRAAQVVELSRARLGARAVAYAAVLRNFLLQARAARPLSHRGRVDGRAWRAGGAGQVRREFG